MAEYIDRTQIPYAKVSCLDKGSIVTRPMIENMATADVIERSKIDKAIEEIKEKSFKHYFELGEYIGEDVRQWEVIELKDVLEILKGI